MNPRAERGAWGLLAAHLALILFSTAAMLTVLAPGAPAAWTSGEPAQTVMRLSFRFAGPSYVVLGTGAMLAFLASRIGPGRAITLAVAASGLALGAELAGTSTGLPFGDYAYSPLLGWRVLGLVPFPIPLSWFYMLAGSLVIVARLRPLPDTRRARWQWALGAGLLMVAWDISMDPAMVRTGHWFWGPGTMFRDAGLPPAVVSFFTRDAFYGMPLANWFGWLLTATLIARVMLHIVPPTAVRQHVAESRFPVALYVGNGIMPVAICIRDGFWWAAGIGAVAMAAPALVAALRPVGMAGLSRLDSRAA